MIRLTVNKITNYMKPTKRILVASLLIMAGILGGCGEQTFDNTTIHVGGAPSYKHKLILIRIGMVGIPCVMV